MKKYLKKFLCGIISVATVLSGITAFAADTMEIKWHGDYSDNNNPKLVVTFISPAPYKQQVTTVIYDADVANPTFADYIRMDEVTVKGSAETELEFDITNAFSATDGAYKVSLQGSGYLRDENAGAETVYVIKQGVIAGLLAEFSSASAATFGTVLDKVMLPLQLEEETDAATKTERINLMLSMKTSDFGGSFATLEDVREAWMISDILVYVNSSSATPVVLAEKIVANAGLLGIVVEDNDFNEYVDTNGAEDEKEDGIADNNDLCAEILENASAYNSGIGIGSVSDFRDIVGESLGTIMINRAGEETLDDAFEKYYDYFDFSADKKTTYNSFTDAKKGVVLRYLYNKNFANAAAIVTAFETAVDLVAAGGGTTDTPIVIVPGVSGGTTGGASISGGGMGGAPTTPSTPPAQTGGFKDVPSDHWANEYITDLANRGIISGYDDNTFRPSNKVTRAEFVKMIIGAAGLYDVEAACEFSDVPADAWYYQYVASAFEKGIISGVDEETFGVNSNITRQDVAVIAARILKYLKAETPEAGDVAFTDAEAISDYATDSVKLLSEMGIVNGFDDGSFTPQGALTRAEAATIIKRLMSFI